MLSYIDGKPTVLDIGGPRRIKATISPGDDKFNIQVSFLSVNCFDSTTNKNLTLQKGKLYCYQALANYLNKNTKNKPIVISVSEPRIVSSEYKDKTFILTMEINNKNITNIDNTAGKSKPGSNKTGLSSLPNLFTSKEDYLNTLDMLKKSDLFLNLPKSFNDGDKFYNEVS